MSLRHFSMSKSKPKITALQFQFALKSRTSRHQKLPQNFASVCQSTTTKCKQPNPMQTIVDPDTQQIFIDNLTFFGFFPTLWRKTKKRRVTSTKLSCCLFNEFEICLLSKNKCLIQNRTKTPVKLDPIDII